jgi:mitogen-activated protein kinase 3
LGSFNLTHVPFIFGSI